ncbi:MAG: hypothetical protein R3F11_29540 [Verrucomicrobiales bacterium]
MTRPPPGVFRPTMPPSAPPTLVNDLDPPRQRTRLPTSALSRGSMIRPQAQATEALEPERRQHCRQLRDRHHLAPILRGLRRLHRADHPQGIVVPGLPGEPDSQRVSVVILGNVPIPPDPDAAPWALRLTGPQTLNPTTSLEELPLAFGTVAGAFYQLETSADAVNWVSLGGEISGTGLEVEVVAEYDPADTERFFRAKRVW